VQVTRQGKNDVRTDALLQDKTVCERVDELYDRSEAEDPLARSEGHARRSGGGHEMVRAHRRHGDVVERDALGLAFEGALAHEGGDIDTVSVAELVDVRGGDPIARPEKIGLGRRIAPQRAKERFDRGRGGAAVRSGHQLRSLCRMLAPIGLRAAKPASSAW
jgi:hypothetical protein